LAFVPISVNPNSATQLQLTQAWQAAFNFPPINLDGGSFKQINSTTSKSFTYYSTGSGWVAATLEVPGDLIAAGTIRGNALAGNEIFTNKLASTNATFASTSSQGFWLDGTTGNARFGGGVSIGGVITNGLLANNVVDYNNIVPGIVNVPLGETFAPTSAVLTNSSTYDWTYTNSSSFYGYHKTLCYTRRTVSQPEIDGGLQISLSFSCNMVGTGFPSYPNSPIFVLWINDSYYGGSGLTRFIPPSAQPRPSGANATGSRQLTYRIPANSFGVTSFTGNISMSSNISLPSGLVDIISPGSTIVAGVSILNGSGSPSNVLGNIQLTNISWGANLS
jgi:hypothetical protein